MLGKRMLGKRMLVLSGLWSDDPKQKSLGVRKYMAIYKIRKQNGQIPGAQSDDKQGGAAGT